MFGLRVMAVTLLTACGLSAAAQPQTFPMGVNAKIEGIIASRSGADMLVKETNGMSAVVELNGVTQVDMKQGLFKLHKRTANVTLLLPGLKVQVDGYGGPGGKLVANKISFTSNDLETARAIQTQVAPVQQKEAQLAAQQKKLSAQEQKLAQEQKQTEQQAQKAQQSASLANQRISELDQYETKFTATVYFGVGQTAVSPEAAKELVALAKKALVTPAYMIQVAGYASKTGSAEINEELSGERAESVITFLAKQGNIPLFRILAPTAMGESSSGGDSAAMNQRVVVNVIVNRGIAQ